MPEKLSKTAGKIEQIILEFDEFGRELDLLRKVLMSNIITKYEILKNNAL